MGHGGESSIAHGPSEATVHALHPSDVKKSVGKLRSEVGPIGAPGTAVVDPAIDEVRPNGFQGHAEDMVKICVQLCAHIELTRVKVSQRPDQGEVEAADVGRAGAPDLPLVSWLNFVEVWFDVIER